MTGRRQSELSPAEAQQVHDAATSASLHPFRMEFDHQFSLVFYAGERAFQTLAEFLKHADQLAELRRST